MRSPFTNSFHFLSIFLLSFLISSQNIFAQAGALDNSFGVNGIVQTNLVGTENNGSNTVLIQNDGKIVVCGVNGNETSDHSKQGLLLRYNKNGSLDSTFGHNGFVQTPAYTFNKAVLQPDGKIVVSMDSLNRNLSGVYTEELARYNTDGSLDSSFGNKGLAVFDSIGFYVSMISDGRGRIYLDSYLVGLNYISVNTISRFLENGKIDTSFNHTGFLNINSADGNVPTIGLQTGSRLIIAYLNLSDSITILRYDSTGKLDTTFKYNGHQFNPELMSVQSDDKIILASNFKNYSIGSFTCLRTNTDGSMDTTFNHSGIDTIYTTSKYTQLYTMSLDHHNNIILAAIYGVDDFYLNFFKTVRILSNGKIDTSFSKNGEANLEIGESHDYPYSIAVQNDNKILITGNSEIRIYEYGNHIVTVRYNVNGTLDKTFATKGIDTPYIYSQTYSDAVSILSTQEGKILVGARGLTEEDTYYYLIQYNNDGTVDSSFNKGIPIKSAFPWLPFAGVANGKIIEIYPDFYSEDSLHIYRYNSDGSLDNSFGKNGQVSTFVDDTTTWYAYDSRHLTLLIQQDGKMLIPGYSGYGSYINLGRLNADGSVDRTFANDGVATIESEYLLDKFSLLQQPDGKILLGAETDPAVSNYIYEPFLLYRFKSDGSLDSSFGRNGVATKLIDSSKTRKNAGFILLQPDGKIIQAGISLGDSTNSGVIAIRYNPNGSIDSTFGVNGIVKTFNPARWEYVNAGILQPDGKILITGNALSKSGYGYNSILLRYLPNGKLDSSFAIDGIMNLGIIPPAKYFDGGNDANTVSLQSDKILIGGSNNYLSQQDLYIARIINDITLGVINFSSPNNAAIVYPNPIHQTATLKYTLSENEMITINLFDVNGKLVKTFIANQNQTKGNYSEQLNLDASLSAGNYFLSITNGKQQETVKIVKM
jgi:uncharacterized delta-60 repeat protein